MSDQKTRPTKKQFETLAFIKEFIEKEGFSPSYREIMNGCNYTSVATVSLHVNNLIKRGHLVKRGNNARSLELVDEESAKNAPTSAEQEHTLTQEIEKRFSKLEKQFEQAVLDEVYVLVGALKILGHMEPARAYAEKIDGYRKQ